MDKTNPVDETILRTPLPTACSTVDRKILRKKELTSELNKAPPDCESDVSSFGILSLNSIDISQKDFNLNTSRKSLLSDASAILERQRLLATSSVERANLTGLPSQYLKPNYSREESTYNISNGSTLNESDLLMSTPCNNSTPRESLMSNTNMSRKSRMSIGQSMAQLSEKITNSNIPLESIIKEFSKTINLENSSSFVPAEDAQQKLLADELSWRKKNEIPVNSETFTPQKIQLIQEKDLSIGEFFQQRSDSMSQLKNAISPEKSYEPIPLIDSTNITDLQLEPPKNKSLSISTIAKIISSDITPKKADNMLMNHQATKGNSSVYEQISLPVSKNSSYTSNYSENEAIQFINKENEDTTNMKRDFLSTCRPTSSASSVISSRSSSTLSSLPNGKLPIETTKQELIWGCVKPNRCVTQEFILRNRSSKSLRIQLAIPGHSFRIRKENRPDSDPLSSMKIVLHAHESRPIIVSFVPTNLGAAIDEIIVTPIDSHLEQTKKQRIRLFGYGGFGNVEIVDITKDTQNKYWLRLGDLTSNNILKQTFIVKNTGTLPSFAFLSVTTRHLFAFSNVTLSNKFFVLIPDEQKEITVTYTPNSDDYKNFQRNLSVVDIGIIKLVWGTEVNRGRLRRLCRKAAEKNVEVNILSNTLKEKIPGEAMPADIIGFKETLDSMSDIFKLFTTNEIVLTLEHDPERTLVPQYPEDSAFYHTLTYDNTRMLEETICLDTCEIEPSNIILTPPYKTDDALFLKSKGNRKLKYQVKSNPEGLNIHPMSGVLNPGETIMFKVKCSKTLTKEKVFKLSVYVENEIFEATVKTIYVKKA